MNFSYSTIADVYAMAEEYPDRKDDLDAFAKDIEQMGVAYFDGVEYIYKDEGYGLEIIATEDL